MKRVTLLLLAASFAATAMILAVQREGASAAGPCNTNDAGMTSEESQFLGLLQQWRNANVAHSTPLETSAALSAAAAWFAQWQVDNGAPGGHNDSFGRNWVQREVDCGYDAYFANGSGEGVYGVAGSQALNIGPAQAITGITYAGSGVRIDTPSTTWPAKCVGVAVKRNASGTVVAWVALIAQYPASQTCPGGPAPVGGGSSPTTSPTNTAASTPTKTATPSPTPSPTPTQRADGASIELLSGWNLVVIPAGDLDSVLYRAKGCFRSVYQQAGDRWLRYSPEAPAYANNLRTSNGGTFWVEGTAANCGRVPL